jgi:aspartyl-tRNA(Asn)/glutamyl-tRNA(Gln) amidotransferase subunit C
MLASSVAAPLTRADVERIAALAHLELSTEEKDLFTRQLAGILAYADEIRQVDTTGVPATSHVLARHPKSRPDVVGGSLPRDAALAGAPDADPASGLIKVPRVLG